MHFAAPPPLPQPPPTSPTPPALQRVCLNTPLLPKHGVFKECHTQTLQLNHRLDAQTESVASLSDATYNSRAFKTDTLGPRQELRLSRYKIPVLFPIMLMICCDEKLTLLLI